MKKLYKYPTNSILLDRWYDHMHNSIDAHTSFFWVSAHNFYRNQNKDNDHLSHKIATFTIHFFKQYNKKYISLLSSKDMRKQIAEMK